MIYLGDGLREKLGRFKEGSYYVLSDYDQTITVGVSSWDLPSKMSTATEGLKEDCRRVGAKFGEWVKEYNKSEDSALRDKIVDWWFEEMDIIVKHKVSLTDMREAITGEGLVCVRDGTREFFKILSGKDVPLIILSAGFEEVIETTLERENCNFKNVEIFANRLRVDNSNHVLGVEGEMIHWLNKSEKMLKPATLKKIENKTEVILIGDQISDIEMLPEHKRDGALKIGFKSNRGDMAIEKLLQHFDIACDIDTSFVEIMDKLKTEFGFEF